MSNVKCHHCPETFTTKSRRNTHTIDCHVLHVNIEWCNVEDSFEKHQLSCDFIFDSTVEIPKELAVHDTLVSVTTKSPFVQDVLKSSATIVSHLSANTNNSSADVLPLKVDTSSTDNSVFELGFPVPMKHDCLIFENIDMSGRFHDFQLQIKRGLNENKHLTLEENVQHLWPFHPFFSRNQVEHIRIYTNTTNAKIC